MPQDWDDRYVIGRRLTDEEAYNLGRRMAEEGIRSGRFMSFGGPTRGRAPGTVRIALGWILLVIGIVIEGVLIVEQINSSASTSTAARIGVVIFAFVVLLAPGGLLLWLGRRARWRW